MKKIDVFAAVNGSLFLVLCVFRYHARFIEYRGAEHIEEFFVYAGVIIAGILLLWRLFRHYEFDGTVLLLVQMGIVLHFAGAFVQLDGHRLYDVYLLGLRYDKYVHFANAFAASILIARLFQIQHIALTPINSVFVLLVVLGLGAVVEIVEYFVVLTVAHQGVGDYHNNLQDLVANLVGASAHLLVRQGLAARTHRGARRLAAAAAALPVRPRNP